jgi:glutamate synthase (ferredoxin)
MAYPPKQGLYDPAYEKDSCGVGFIVHMRGEASHAIVRDALTVLRNLSHRGACGCESNTGDGAGILLQIPHEFFAAAAADCGISLPSPGRYGVGMVFLPRDPEAQKRCEQTLEDIIREEGQEVLGWRTVPVDNSSLGATAVAGEPLVRQIFVGLRSGIGSDDLAFERVLYVIRRRAENALRSPGQPSPGFYVASLSTRTIVYKGMLMSEQVESYYPELLDPRVQSALALVHSRFSTNTFPNWERSHPYRMVAHNGEINTLRGNVNAMRARQALCESDIFGERLASVMPVIDEDGSDSAMFDNVLEFLTLTGRSLPHAVMMMIPEPWEKDSRMDRKRRDFYRFHSCLMEPWDGPASIAFTDGVQIGAVLDRNGLRPSRYYVTDDGRVIMASEVGVLDVDPQKVVLKGRLQPGRMFLVDTREGRIVADEELKAAIASEHPYREWLAQNLISFHDLPEQRAPARPEPQLPLLQRQKAFGYTWEDLRFLMAPMGEDGVEPIGSMGTDTPLAALSDRPYLLYNYFKQLFAQVTNPPLDAIREEIVTSTTMLVGSEGNLLRPGAGSFRLLELDSPILTNSRLETLRSVREEGFRAVTLPMLFPASGGGEALERALEDLFTSADRAIEEGANILILSDRGVDQEHAPIPALLAVSGLHHHLIRTGTRMKVSLVVESGEPREVHHMALLVGYGASAINPYLAFETLADLIANGLVREGVDYATAEKNYVKALTKGIVKTMSKMGISTIQSYRGAQIFEAVGLKEDFVERYFTGTASRVEGVGAEVIAQEALARHHNAFTERAPADRPLESGGLYQWRSDGEYHLFNPETIHKMQRAVRSGDYELFREFSRAVNDQSRHYCTLRGLLKFRENTTPVPLDEVEPVESIVRRFKTGAMSYGSISKEAHETLAIAMNRLGGKSNTGEGGEDPERYRPLPNGDSKCSAIKQVASGRFGVTSHYLMSAQEIQIKMAQGAKPGEGGQLPGHKVYPWIAKVRFSTPGVGLISPPPHHDIYSIEDLAELIHDLKNANPRARISVKLVSEVGVGTIAAGVAKAHADVVLISGYDGGTGASPLSSIKHAGVPWELGLAETHQTLVLNGLRTRIAVETDGQLRTGRDVAIAALLGAEEFGFATSPLVAIGCVMMRVCHKNTCPVGVATQDPELRRKFQGQPEHVENYMRFVAMELREIMAQLGFRTVNEMVGRSDLLVMDDAVEHWKARGLDLSRILHRPEGMPLEGQYKREEQDHGLDRSLDRRRLLEICRPALESGKQVIASVPIRNTDRVVGTILGSEVTRLYGPDGLPDGTIHLKFTGSAGQSFGAFVPRGITLELEGDANDYLGKGLCGGRIIVYPPRQSPFAAEENIIIGNVAFYGATSGEAYVCGAAGERFCVRNSGVTAVVEAVGDHGCEYMTGGRVVVLGPTGRNFAAGMSGGIAYVLDPAGDFESRCNTDMVDLFDLTDDVEIEQLRRLVERHGALTGSALARRILRRWDEAVPQFVKVLPRDYRRMLEKMEEMERKGLSGEEAVMAAFEANARDLARIGGN